MFGRALGVDYGRRRIGVALSDPLRTVATPVDHLPVQNMKEGLQQLEVLISEREATTVVVGRPLHMNGDEGELAKEAAQFADKLKKRRPNLEVVMWDERLTSKQAERVLIEADTSRRKRKRVVDKLAAQILLQSWLDAQAFPPMG